MSLETTSRLSGNHLEDDGSSVCVLSLACSLTHPSRTVVKSIEVFMESSQVYAATGPTTSAVSPSR